MRRCAQLVVVALLAVACSESGGSPPPPPAPADAGPYCPYVDGSILGPACAGPSNGGCSRPFLFGCSLICYEGRADCNHDAKDGCEVDFRSDPNNCGACQATASSCIDGLAGPPPEELFECGATVEGVAVDGSNLYVMCDGVLQSMPKGGGPRTTLSEGEWTYPRAGIQIADGALYWAWRSTAKTGRVRRVALGGGDVETILTGVNPGSNVLVHAGVAYVIDAELTGTVDVGHVVDSTGRTLIECGRAGSLAAIGDVLYVGDARTGVLRSVRFDGGDPKVLGAAEGVVVSDGVVLRIASDKLVTYQPGIGFSAPSPLGFHVDDAMLGSGDAVVWTRGSTHYSGELLEGTSLLASLDPASGRATVRARVDARGGWITLGRAIGPIAQDATHVYFGTTGTLERAATISRFAK